jgi:hypothetical protein
MNKATNPLEHPYKHLVRVIKINKYKTKIK